MSATTKMKTSTTTMTAPEAPVLLIDPILSQTTDLLDQVTDSYRAAIAATAGHLRRAMLLARGIAELRKLLDDKLMAHVLPLMNSPLGFKTDRPNKRNEKPYSMTEVRDCLIAALLNGFYPVNNEFNIISGQFYGALNGYKRKVEEVDGITDLRVAPGVPLTHNGQTVVRVAASWRLNGIAKQLIGPDGKPGHPFPIISGEYVTADALIGKARRKAYKLIYELVTGSTLTVADGEVGEPIDYTPKPSKVGQVLAQAKVADVAENGELANAAQLREIARLSQKLQISEDEFHGLAEQFGAGEEGDPHQLSTAQADELIAHLEDLNTSNKEGKEAHD